jgi:hypothetical protein
LFPYGIPRTVSSVTSAAYVCPHAAIRPFVLDENEQKAAKFNDQLKAVGKAFAGMTFRIRSTFSTVSVAPTALMFVRVRRRVARLSMKLISKDRWAKQPTGNTV